MHWRERLAGSAARTRVAALRIRSHLAELGQERDRARQAQAQAEAALQKLGAAQAELLRAEQRATAGSLIAAMAHQINTPLGTCLTAASTLMDAQAQLGRALEHGTLRRSTLQDHLRLSQDSLDLVLGNLGRLDQLGTRFRRFATAPRASRFDLAQAVASAVDMALQRSGQPTGRIVIEVSESQCMCCDRSALVELLVELLTNALQAARVGDPPVRLAADWGAAPDASTATLRLQVSDHGPGMPAAALARAREPYAQRTDLVNGLGLGWRIVHHLVHQVLNGTLALESTPQRGTTVVVSLPQAEPGEALPTV